MDRSKDKISIITVCYNAGSDLEATIRSVTMQTYPAIEYIIIDGASTDDTKSIVRKFEKDIAVFMSEPDEGIYDAMNKGIKLATGEWIFFLGSDDIFFDNEVLERIFSNVSGKEEILYGNVKFLHSGIIYDGPFNQEKISVKNICHQALFVKKIVFEKIGLFNCKYKLVADYEFNIKWMGLKLPSLYTHEVVVIFNEKGKSGQVIDEVFYENFDTLLIENNIISQRSFLALKRMHKQAINSYRYKIGNFLLSPFSWLRSKILSHK